MGCGKKGNETKIYTVNPNDSTNQDWIAIPIRRFTKENIVIRVLRSKEMS
ncbi:hypothetical protein [endosymbiont 'TC1' of Trimyema compressum]|nr:hypothetical protein [endosymbiont 'TC1' of Trimyema compressum]